MTQPADRRLVTEAAGNATYALKGEAGTASQFGRVLGSSLDGTAHLTASGGPILLSLDRCIRTDILVETSTDGATWTARHVQDDHTGAVTDRAYTVGVYSVLDSAGATHVRATADTSRTTLGADAYRGRLWEGYSRPDLAPRFAPTPAIPEATMIQGLGWSGYMPHPATPNVVYGKAGSNVGISTNGGQNWSSIGALPGAVQQIWFVSSGHILAWCKNGTVYKSADAYPAGTTTWTAKHTVETPGQSASASFGISVVGDIAVYAEYGPNALPDQPRRAYQSDDAGEAWRKIFEGPANGTTGNTWHPHGIRYDPYEDLVWLVNGDGPSNANIYVRPRKTEGHDGWIAMFPSGLAPSQWTSVVPLPSCVLFLSDNFNQSIWRYDRRTRGLSIASSPTVEMAESIELHRSPEAISTTPWIDRSGPVHAAYFGWNVHSSNSKIVHLWATADGLTFHKVWSSPRAPLNEGQSDIYVGIMGAAGVDTENRILITHVDRTQGAPGPTNLIKLDRPTWNRSTP